jgi:hypothetical protein
LGLHCTRWHATRPSCARLQSMGYQLQKRPSSAWRRSVASCAGASSSRAPVPVHAGKLSPGADQLPVHGRCNLVACRFSPAGLIAFLHEAPSLVHLDLSGSRLPVVGIVAWVRARAILHAKKEGEPVRSLVFVSCDPDAVDEVREVVGELCESTARARRGRGEGVGVGVGEGVGEGEATTIVVEERCSLFNSIEWGY